MTSLNSDRNLQMYYLQSNQHNLLSVSSLVNVEDVPSMLMDQGLVFLSGGESSFLGERTPFWRTEGEDASLENRGR